MREPKNEKLAEDVLRKLYVDDPKATLTGVSEVLGIHRDTIRRALLFYGFPVRSRARREGVGLKPHTKLLANREWLEEQLKTKNMVQISKDLGCPDDTVFWWARKHGLVALNVDKSNAIKAALRKAYPNGSGGENSSAWKGGRYRIKTGYVRVYAPDHPDARNNTVFEHRLVMEKVLGRYLEADEIVHHIDGNKSNNDPANLALTRQGDHISQHWKAGHEVIKMRVRMKELEAIIVDKDKEIAMLKEQLA